MLLMVKLMQGCLNRDLPWFLTRVLDRFGPKTGHSGSIRWLRYVIDGSSKFVNGGAGEGNRVLPYVAQIKGPATNFTKYALYQSSKQPGCVKFSRPVALKAPPEPDVPSTAPIRVR